ncbi:MAG: hypothetical protein DLM70_07815 [Chloroflexi bacterium]|nr:MAG: hypothetical protein DLM70_07815 [Chloroflexota bacterium]
MDALRLFYEGNGFLLAIFLPALLIIVGILATLSYTRSKRIEKQFDAVFHSVSGDNTARVLGEYLTTVRNTAASVNRMREQHEDIVSTMPSVVRHVGLVRFSPFHDTGGDQSFTLALLDGQADGVILTALHSRSDSRLYAKPVESGRSSYSLSPEEEQAVERALNHRQPAESGTEGSRP